MKVLLIALSFITGTVVDSETKEPITGAKVEVLGQEKSTYTDFDGIYKMSELSDTTELKVSFITYQDTVIKVNDLKNNEGFIYLTSY
jgi:hypothetical protein